MVELLGAAEVGISTENAHCVARECSCFQVEVLWDALLAHMYGGWQWRVHVYIWIGGLPQKLEL
jgi:hypothetical protein